MPPEVVFCHGSYNRIRMLRMASHKSRLIGKVSSGTRFVLSLGKKTSPYRVQCGKLVSLSSPCK